MKGGDGYCSDQYQQKITVSDGSVDAGTKTFKKPPKKK